MVQKKTDNRFFCCQ